MFFVPVHSVPLCSRSLRHRSRSRWLQLNRFTAGFPSFYRFFFIVFLLEFPLSLRGHDQESWLRFEPWDYC
jgi:hypothetical protein